MNTTRHQRQSTTIIEVVTALVILSIALPPMVRSFADASVQTMFPASEAIASFLAIERMEEIVARRYRNVNGYTDIAVANFPDEAAVGGFSTFSRTVTVSYVTAAMGASGTDVGYRKVRVTVSWNSGGNTVFLERIFADF